jgi:hypothetical protein
VPSQRRFREAAGAQLDEALFLSTSIMPTGVQPRHDAIPDEGVPVVVAVQGRQANVAEA